MIDFHSQHFAFSFLLLFSFPTHPPTHPPTTSLGSTKTIQDWYVSLHFSPCCRVYPRKSPSNSICVFFFSLSFILSALHHYYLSYLVAISSNDAAGGASALTPDRAKKLEDIGFEWVCHVGCASANNNDVCCVTWCGPREKLLLLILFFVEF